MGQAVDLPDPTQAPAPVAAVSADDLLSQLAGDEIDRLLAESDAEAAAATQAEAPAPASTTTEPAAPSSTTPPATAESSAAPESPAADPSASPSATEGLVNELDTLLTQALSKDAPTVAPESAASTDTPPTAPAATETAALPAVDAKALDESLATQAAATSELRLRSPKSKPPSRSAAASPIPTPEKSHQKMPSMRRRCRCISSRWSG